jgi:hypothetical protein
MQPGVVTGAVFEFHAARSNTGYYPGVDTNATAYDTSGSEHHATISGATYAGLGTTASPYRLVFDGVDDYVSLPAAVSPGLSDFTLEVWASIAATADNHGLLIGYEYNDAGGWGIYCHEDFVAGFVTPTGFADRKLVAISMANALRHYVVTFDRDGLAIPYANGVAGTTVDISSTAALNLSAAGVLGEYSGWFASIEEACVRVYHGILTPAQVAQNYAVGTVWNDFKALGRTKQRGVIVCQ